MNHYFWDEASGVNADIERHRKEEIQLQQKIKELESKAYLSEFEQRCLKTYRHLAALLWASKAKVLEQLGKKD